MNALEISPETIEKAKAIAAQLNDIGVFCYVEVNNTQYKFELNVKDLAPSSPIFGPNQDNIENTKYTLIPIEDAKRVYGIGKKLFDKHLLKNEDYISLKHMRFVDARTLKKMENSQQILIEEMKNKATKLFGASYDELFRKSFVYAFEFFAKENDNYRDELNKLKTNVDLSWKEVDGYFARVAELKDIAKRNGMYMSVSGLTSPGLKAAYKTYHVPKTFENYISQIRFTTIQFGFHYRDFIEWPNHGAISKIRNLFDVKHFIEPDLERSQGLFDNI